MATKTPKAPKASKTAATAQDAGAASSLLPPLIFAPDTFMALPSPRDNTALATALRDQSAFHDGETNKTTGHAAALAFVDSLSDDDYAAVWRWVRAVSWLFAGEVEHHERPAVRRDELQVPAAFAALVDPEIGGPDAVIDHYAPSQINAWQIVEDTIGTLESVVRDEAPAPTPVPEADGQLPLVQEDPKAAKPIKAMSFRGPDEVVCVNRALSARLADLDAEAKRLDGLGKPVAAKDCRDEVLLIKRQLLPQVTAQMALPFNEREALPSLVGRMVAGEVRSRARAQLFKSVTLLKGEKMEDAKARKQETLDTLEGLIGNIGEQVGAIVTRLLDAVAERGIDAGKRAIAIDSGNVAREALQLVEAELQSARKDAA